MIPILSLALITVQVPTIFCIIGGEDVEPHEFPFMAWSYYNTNLDKSHPSIERGCAGALISRTDVLTAKSCFIDKKEEFITVRFGDEEGYVMRDVVSIIPHPDQNMAILSLDHPINFTDHVRAISLDNAANNGVEALGFNVGQTVTVAGPGCTKAAPEGGCAPDGKLSPSKLMMKVDLELVNNKDCGKNGLEGNKTICATSPGTGPWRTGCHGDAGAPLFVSANPPSTVHYTTGFVTNYANYTLLGVVVGPGPGDTDCAGDTMGTRVLA